MTRLALFALVLLLLLSALPVRAQPGPQFAAARCPFVVPKGLPVSCGYVSVPENRARPDSRQIRLMVAIVRGKAPRAADPVLYLAGGPGSSAVYSTATLARGWAGFLGNRDLIVVDQRGTGFSQPALTCPELAPVHAAHMREVVVPEVRLDAEHDALMRCRERLLRAGVDVGAYSSAANAADLRDLRRVLGYRQWNLLGISYGTRLALTALRYDAEGIRSVVLDSVYPPQANLFTGLPPNLDRALRTLFDGCAASERCAATYPNLEGQFYALVERLNAEPITVRVRDPRGASVPMRVDGARLIEVVFRMLYVSAELPRLPQMIAATAAGDYSQLARMQASRLARSQGVSEAMYYAVECQEDMALIDLAQARAAVAEHPRLHSYYAGTPELNLAGFALCAAWRPGPPDPAVAAPVVSDVPALLLAGEYDPITAPAWADDAAATLSRSEVYHFPGTGHAVITRGACPHRMIAAFLNGLSAAPVGGCAAKLGPPAFVGR
ncbi:MAG: alpha/beta fold hydrolase [Roseiflexaceae bacterium]